MSFHIRGRVKREMEVREGGEGKEKEVGGKEVQ
jgi:hypothetical protein